MLLPVMDPPEFLYLTIGMRRVGVNEARSAVDARVCVRVSGGDGG